MLFWSVSDLSLGYEELNPIAILNNATGCTPFISIIVIHVTGLCDYGSPKSEEFRTRTRTRKLCDGGLILLSPEKNHFKLIGFLPLFLSAEAKPILLEIRS